MHLFFIQCCRWVAYKPIIKKIVYLSQVKRYVIRPRYYLNDHNLPKLLDKIGLKEKDIKQLEQRRMMYP